MGSGSSSGGRGWSSDVPPVSAAVVVVGMQCLSADGFTPCFLCANKLMEFRELSIISTAKY